MYEQQLNQAGLTLEQAEIYEVLLKNGPLLAGQLNKKSTLKRGLIYKILDILVEKGLVEKKEEEGKAAIFLANHPLKLKEVVEKREQRAKDAHIALDGILPSLVSDFNLISGQPGIQFSEGITGIEKVYDDIIIQKKDIYLFRSVYDNDHPELEKIVNKQIKRQVASNIHTYALTPLVKDTPKTVLENDEKNLVQRRIMPKEKFMLDSQIIIYGNKLAIISLKNKIITTVIDNDDISNTFKTIFDYFWEKAKPEHDEYWKNIWGSGEAQAASDSVRSS